MRGRKKDNRKGYHGQLTPDDRGANIANDDIFIALSTLMLEPAIEVDNSDLNDNLFAKR